MTPAREEDHLAHVLGAQVPDLGEPAYELRFHPSRRWRFDLAWPARMLAAEIHGAVFQAGRHTSGSGFTADREKMNTAQLYGWTILEFTPAEVRSGKAARTLRVAALGGMS